MRGKDGIFWTTVCLTFILVIGSVAQVADFDDNDFRPSVIVLKPEKGNVFVAGTPHAPIVIDGDVNFSATALAESWLGDGSSGSPFVIDGLDIDLGGVAGHCISITNTRVNFTISNCNLTGANVNPGAGIYLENVTHGEIVGNIFDNNYFNVYLTDSHFVLVKNNLCPNSVYGISLRNLSSKNTITDNNCSFNFNRGLTLESGSNLNVVMNNTCNNNDFGVVLINANNNTVANGTFNGNTEDGIHVNNGDFNIFNSNTFNNNYRGVNCITDSDSNTFSNNTCRNNGDYGFRVWGVSSFNILNNNTCTSNGYFGILVQNSPSNILINNLITGSNHGIRLEGSTMGHYNTITNNTCNNNVEYGISSVNSNNSTMSNNTCSGNLVGIHILSADYNTVIWNAFTDSTIFNGFDNALGTFFDYNYWSDYSGSDADGNGIGDSPYAVSPSGSVDSHPLFYLPTLPMWSETPLAHEVEFSYSLYRYDLNITCPSPVTWFIEHSLFEIDSQGVVSSLTILPIDTYRPRVSVINIYGSPLTAILQVHVRDTTPPSWVIPPVDQVHEYGEALDCQLVSADLSGIAYWTLNDTTHFTITATPFHEGSTARITNATDLAFGVYWLNVSIYDTYGNNLSTIFRIIIELPEQDTSPPEWIIAPTNQFLDFGESLVVQLGAWDESGIDYWWINDTVRFSINEYGVIINNMILSPRVYTLNVTVYDPSGNSLSTIFSITVNPPEQDTTPPTWVTLRIYQTIDYGEALQVQVEAWDESGIDHWWLNDTIHFTLDELGVIRNATTLDPGIYRLEVRAYDPFNNYCSVILVVTVLEDPLITTTTTTTTISTTDTTSTTPEGVDPVMTLVLGAGIGGVAVVVIVIVFLRRKP